MLDYLGIPYVQSQGEAEAMCAVLNSEGVSQEGEGINRISSGRRWNLKLKCRKYPAMHTNRMVYHCTTLQYNI